MTNNFLIRLNINTLEPYNNDIDNNNINDNKELQYTNEYIFGL